MNCFEILEIERTTNKRAIRHAYAALTKKYHIESDPDRFLQIREAYEQAMTYAELPAEEASPDEEMLSDGADTENVFYETSGFEQVYGSGRQDEILELEGLKKLTADMDSGRAKGIPYFKNFVLSQEFVRYQYDRYYIRALADAFVRCHGTCRQQQFDDMFLCIGIIIIHVGIFIDRIIGIIP